MSKEDKQTEQALPVVALTIEQFMGIISARLRPGKVTILQGGNASGKTSVIRAIEAVLVGGADTPERIRKGARKAAITVELADKTLVQWRQTPAGQYLDVSRDEFKRGSPRTWLSELIGSTLSFNPIEFFTAKPARQREMLLSAIPVEVTGGHLQHWFGDDFGLDTDRHGLEVLADVEQLAYAARRDANALVKQLQGREETLADTVPDDFDADHWRGVDVSALNARVREAGQAEQRQADLEAQLERNHLRAQSLEEKRRALMAQLAEVEQAQAATAEEQKVLETQLADIQVPDVSDVEAALGEYTEAQKTLAAYDNLADIRSQLKTAAEDARRWNLIVEGARTKPVELLSQAEAPIEGLEVTADDILVGGLPIRNLSSSEQLMFAIRVARMLQKQFPIICIDGAELLDAEHFAILMAEAEADDYQYVITRVASNENEETGEPEPLPLEVIVDGQAQPLTDDDDGE